MWKKNELEHHRWVIRTGTRVVLVMRSEWGRRQQKTPEGTQERRDHLRGTELGDRRQGQNRLGEWLRMERGQFLNPRVQLWTHGVWDPKPPPAGDLQLWQGRRHFQPKMGTWLHPKNSKGLYKLLRLDLVTKAEYDHCNFFLISFSMELELSWVFSQGVLVQSLTRWCVGVCTCVLMLPGVMFLGGYHRESCLDARAQLTAAPVLRVVCACVKITTRESSSNPQD